MLTLIPLVFINCEKETTIQEEVITQQAITVTRLSEKELKENTQLITELNKFKSSKNSMQSLSREEYISEYDFSVETTEAIYIENGDYHSYTFKVYREEGSNVLENLLLSQQGGLSYKAYLISYNITEQERELIARNEYISLIDKIESTELVDFDADVILSQRDDGECYEWVEETSQATGWKIMVKKAVPCENDSISGDETNNGGGSSNTGGSGNTGGDDQESPDTSDDANASGGGTGNTTGAPTEPEEITSPTLSTEEIALAEILDCVSLPPNLTMWLLEQSQLPRNIINSSIQGFIQNGCTPETQAFIPLAIEAWMEGGDVDLEELYIKIPTPDDTYEYTGPKALIPNPLVLDNGDLIDITFGTTKWDNLNANQEVSLDLINGLKFALEMANNNLSSTDQIYSIYIMATTNGHNPNQNPNSNHLKGTALDISRINGQKMILTGITNQIIELQEAFDNFEYIRENFGPYFKHKFSVENPVGSQWNYNYIIGGHSDHIHISVRR